MDASEPSVERTLWHVAVSASQTRDFKKQINKEKHQKHGYILNDLIPPPCQKAAWRVKLSDWTRTRKVKMMAMDDQAIHVKLCCDPPRLQERPSCLGLISHYSFKWLALFCCCNIYCCLFLGQSQTTVPIIGDGLKEWVHQFSFGDQ